MSMQTFKPTRIPAALALVALVLSAVSMLGLTESPADAYSGKPKARADKAAVLAGQKVVLDVLANDRIGTKKAKVRLVAVPTPGTVGVSVNRKQRVVIKAVATAKPGRYTATYQVVDAKKRKAKATIAITVAARSVVTPTPTPTPSATPTPTVTPTVSPSATPTVTPTATPTPAPDSLVAVINSLPVAAEVRTGYDRTLFKHWNSGLPTGSGGIAYCDTREEVLISESTIAATYSGSSCTITAGSWFSYYDGATWTDPADLDIDHMVALAEAWDSGAHAWTAAQREAYANDQGDPRSLVAVTDNVNQSKGDQDPGEWWPLLERCRYTAEWTATKARFSLTVDQVEKDALLLQASQCGDTTVTYTKAW